MTDFERNSIPSDEEDDFSAGLDTSDTTPPKPLTPKPASAANAPSAPKFSFEDVLGDDKNISRLTKKVLKKIEKEGWERFDFSVYDNRTVFDFEFPPHYSDEDDFLKNFAHIFFDGDAAWAALAEYNDLNRPANIAAIVKNAAMILTGRWKEFTQEGIAFSRPRDANDVIRLQDGQHRLLSIYLASKIDPKAKIRLLVLFNADPDNCDNIDQGTVRGTKDKLVMMLKRDGYVFKNDSYQGIKDKDIISVVKAMPGHSGITEDRALAFAKKHLETIVEFILVLQGIRNIRYKASWAGPFIMAGIAFGKSTILPLTQRLVEENWIRNLPKNRIDPLRSFHERMLKDANASPSMKIRGDGIKAMAMYAIRKCLMEEDVSDSRGSRYLAEHIRFSLEEVEDYKLNGSKSKILKQRSKARQRRSSRSE